MAEPPLLAARRVDFAYGRAPVLSQVDLEVRRGEVLGIIGPNGAGKSTLLALLTGCLAPRRGEILFEGRPLPRHSPAAIAQRLAVVPQAAPIAFGHSVADVVAMGRHPHRGAFRWNLGPEDLKRVVWALERTDTLPLAARPFNALSGGEQQLVLIARALAQSTEVLLLDEPTASLDLHHQAQVAEILLRLHREEGTTIIWVSHDLNLVGRCCPRLALLARGRVIADGPPAAILDAGLLREVYQTDVTVEVFPDGRHRVDLNLALPEMAAHR